MNTPSLPAAPLLLTNRTQLRPFSRPLTFQPAQQTSFADGFAGQARLQVPAGASAVVLFAHGAGSSCHGRRNKALAAVLREAGIATLLFDLLTPEERREDAMLGTLRFDIPLLAQRVMLAVRWLQAQPLTRGLKIGCLGASSGAAAALSAAAQLGREISAIVCRGGRPDLARNALPCVTSPTLLIVGGCDDTVICLNGEACLAMQCEKEFRIVAGATHLFSEPGMLAEVARLSVAWFTRHLCPAPDRKGVLALPSRSRL